MSDASIFDVVDATWPAARTIKDGPWILREGKGGGKRVSAASTEMDVEDADIDQAEQAMARLGQDALFMLRNGQQGLDRLLETRGYRVLDPVTAYACPVVQLTDIPLPRVTVFEIWEPLAIMLEIWAKGGIGPARVDVMRRATGPKTSLLGRWNEHPAAAAFVAMHGDTAMVHAIEVLEHQRRHGMGAWIMRGAAFWAARQGAKTLSVVCTDENTGANRLYTSLGMAVVGHYHYRYLPDEKDKS